MNLLNTPRFSMLLSAMIVAFASCQQGDPDALDNTVPEDRQIKVYHELRTATKRAGGETLEAYQDQAGMDPAALRAMQDSLRLAYWQEVCDSNHVTLAYGDSIWTKGVKEKWSSLLE